MTKDELKVLAGDVREALLSRLTRIGGHIGPNFGIVEVTIALHYVFNSPKDKFVFDVSHQCYPHKIITGRKFGFLDLDRYSEVSGYTNQDESEHDFFKIGHTSTSVSLATGLVKARDLRGAKENIIAIIGDGSLSGGEAFEGLNMASEIGTNMIIVANDNDMSIAENHGGLYKNLRELRESNGQSQNNYFKSLGLDYVYVDKGNDLDALIEVFEKVKDTDHPIVVHVHTQKGKGLPYAEKDKETWHYGMPFDPKTGESKVNYSGGLSNDTAEFLMDKMEKDPTIAVVTSGTPTVLGFTKDRRDKFSKQFIDVGIAEEQAVAMISGMAKNGGKPIYGVFSTFIQRTYDQLSQDLAINNNPATILIFGGGLGGMNDVTHLCWFDIPLVSNIPNIVFLAPTSKEEYFAMLDWSIEYKGHSVVIRVPSQLSEDTGNVQKDFSDLNKYLVTEKGKEVAILGLGNFYKLGKEVRELLKESGIDATLINPRYASGLDETLLNELKAEHKLAVTLEDGVIDGGFGEKIARFYGTSDMKVLNYGIRKEFTDRVASDVAFKNNRLTKEQIVKDILRVVK